MVPIFGVYNCWIFGSYVEPIFVCDAIVNIMEGNIGLLWRWTIVVYGEKYCGERENIGTLEGSIVFEDKYLVILEVRCLVYFKRTNHQILLHKSCLSYDLCVLWYFDVGYCAMFDIHQVILSA